MQQSEAIERVSSELGIPKSVVENVYKAHWKYVVEKFREIPFNDKVTKEEFDKYFTAVKIPHVGTLYCSWKNYQTKIKHVRKANEDKITEHGLADDNECL